jgi:hypothetical protein
MTPHNPPRPLPRVFFENGGKQLQALQLPDLRRAQSDKSAASEKDGGQSEEILKAAAPNY